MKEEAMRNFSFLERTVVGWLVTAPLCVLLLAAGVRGEGVKVEKMSFRAKSWQAAASKQAKKSKRKAKEEKTRTSKHQLSNFLGRGSSCKNHGRQESYYVCFGSSRKEDEQIISICHFFSALVLFRRDY